MPEDSGSEGIVSEAELVQLTALFRQSEGAPNPLSDQAQHAKHNFNSLARHIYVTKVKPKFIEIDFSMFLSLLRNQCRSRAFRQGPQFPCV